jgi:hypothetical protein
MPAPALAPLGLRLAPLPLGVVDRAALRRRRGALAAAAAALAGAAAPRLAAATAVDRATAAALGRGRGARGLLLRLLLQLLQQRLLCRRRGRLGRALEQRRGRRRAARAGTRGFARRRVARQLQRGEARLGAAQQVKAGAGARDEQAECVGGTVRGEAVQRAEAVAVQRIDGVGPRCRERRCEALDRGARVRRGPERPARAGRKRRRVGGGLLQRRHVRGEHGGGRGRAGGVVRRAVGKEHPQQRQAVKSQSRRPRQVGARGLTASGRRRAAAAARAARRRRGRAGAAGARHCAAALQLGQQPLERLRGRRAEGQAAAAGRNAVQRPQRRRQQAHVLGGRRRADRARRGGAQRLVERRAAAGGWRGAALQLWLLRERAHQQQAQPRRLVVLRGRRVWLS